MASSSKKQLFCIFHVGGEYVKTLQGKTVYEGGMILGRLITKGMKHEELKRMVATDVWPGNNGFRMKYTVSYAEETLLDLVDDVGVDQLIDYNNSSGHVYVCKNEKKLNEASQLENPQEIDEFSTPSLGRSISPPIWDFDTEYVRSPIESQPTPITPIVQQSGEVGSNTQSLTVESLPTPMPVMNSSKWKDLFVGIGQTFCNAVEFRETLYKYSLAHKFAYRFVKNGKDKIIVKCAVEGCPWYISAYGVDNRNSFLVVRRFETEHKHYAQDNLVVPHKKRCTLTSAVIVDELRSTMEKPPTEIRKDLEREYGVRLSYQQAYRAKEKALLHINGRPEESYMLIPWICDRLKETDEDTVAEWVASSNNRFQAVFIAYGCSIKGFLEGARPILYVDGCHLSGPYKGTLVGAHAYDADNELFPLAYAIVGGETFDDWAWFLQKIKDITGSLELTIVSDRHNAIISAVHAIYGSDRHGYCYRHLKENYSAEFLKITRGRRRASGETKEAALKFLDAIAYARRADEFNEAMENLKKFCLPLAQWLECNGDIDRWAQSKFPYKRWDNITTNLAESFNAWLVSERRHNIGVLIHEHREKLAKKMHNTKLGMRNWTNGVGPNIEAKLMENVARSERMDVQDYGMNAFRVRTAKGDIRVNLTMRECSCKAWQMSGLPCPHACAAIKEIHGNVYAYVEDCFLLSAQEKIYNRTMIPVETHDIPRPDSLRYHDYSSTILLQPPVTSRPPGRPRVHRVESQFQGKKVYHCSRCGGPGHTRKTCTNPNPC